MSIVLQGVGKQVGGAMHLAEVDLTLEPGNLYVLFGLTQSGKTSLMRLMASLDRPSSGQVLVDGKDMTSASVRERSVAMVYQQFINYPAFNVHDNIASPLRIQRRPKAEIEQKVRDAARLLHIDHLMDRLPAELSGGQQQRVAIARALVKEADLLLLDEPLVNLDYKLREELRSELKAIFQRGRAIVVYATTEPAEALLLGGHTIVVDQGRILQAGPTLEVFHHPASVRVTQVFSEPPMNLIEGTIEPGRLRLGATIAGPLPAHLERLAPGPYRFGTRANHLFLARDKADDLEVEAAVELAEVSGSETFVHVSHHGVPWIVQKEGVHSFQIGQAIRIYLKPRRLFAFDPAGRLAAAPAFADALVAAE
jgi:glycerol transport system ATP-binding protein